MSLSGWPRSRFPRDEVTALLLSSCSDGPGSDPCLRLVTWLGPGLTSVPRSGLEAGPWRQRRRLFAGCLRRSCFCFQTCVCISVQVGGKDGGGRGCQRPLGGLPPHNAGGRMWVCVGVSHRLDSAGFQTWFRWGESAPVPVLPSEIRALTAPGDPSPEGTGPSHTGL